MNETKPFSLDPERNPFAGKDSKPAEPAAASSPEKTAAAEQERQAAAASAAPAGPAPAVVKAVEKRDLEKQAELFRERFKRLRTEIQKAMVGQKEVIDGTLTSMVSGGHVLLEGVPGLGKTFLLRTLASALALDFSRVQFTPDLMPADILGTNLVMETEHGGKFFQFQKGPIFTNILLADEINRATPKTQSALLEAMQEKRVTAAGETRTLDRPFFVLATQNPLEMEGTYPLPEAQLDRFFFKIDVPFPTLAELEVIMDRTTGGHTPEVSQVVTKEEFLEMQAVAREVPIAKHVQNYAMRMVLATHPGQSHATPMVNQFVSYGSSPRGAQTLVLAGKVKALLDGRLNVSFEDIVWAAKPALRHRVILNFEGEAEGVNSDQLIAEILRELPKDAALAANL
jgi:MoxR-like ATPase